MSMSKNISHNGVGLFGLTLGALGVVYGDIGTSPLYAMKEIFFGHEHTILNQASIYGVTSLVFWALTIVVSIKYILLVLRADHMKEGGVFALYALLRHVKTRYTPWLLGLLVLAAGLLFGDGIITPAISVVSAVEGIGVAAPSMSRFVVPITIGILSVLFVVQQNGTSKIGKVFGPVMLVWFLSLAVIGIGSFIRHPDIIAALNPYWAYHFLTNTPTHHLLIVLGFVMLVVTGGEAMYADMGHFGRTPIRLGWLAIAYPALILNYLGQGAYLLSGSEVVGGSIFFSMIPSWALYPMIALATLATIIASQAMITGAFSLASQAYSLYLLPYLPTKHTYEGQEGQIYIGLINIFLYVGCIILVLVFQSSTNLAAAYGLAVAGCELITTLSVATLARHLWKWSWWQVIMIFVPFWMIDWSFFVANALKFFEGGYVPVTIGIGMLLVMKTWNWGANLVQNALYRESKMTVKELMKYRDKQRNFTPNTVVIISEKFIESSSDLIPHLNQLYLQKYGMLPEHLVFLTVYTHHEPYMINDRFTIVPIDIEPASGTILSVKLNFGFMEEPNIEKYMQKLVALYPQAVNVDRTRWIFHVIVPRVLTRATNIVSRIRNRLFKIMYKLALDEDEQFGLGKKYHVTAEVVPILINK